MASASGAWHSQPPILMDQCNSFAVHRADIDHMLKECDWALFYPINQAHKLIHPPAAGEMQFAFVSWQDIDASKQVVKIGYKDWI